MAKPKLLSWHKDPSRSHSCFTVLVLFLSLHLCVLCPSVKRTCWSAWKKHTHSSKPYQDSQHSLSQPDRKAEKDDKIWLTQESVWRWLRLLWVWWRISARPRDPLAEAFLRPIATQRQTLWAHRARFPTLQRRPQEVTYERAHVGKARVEHTQR